VIAKGLTEMFRMALLVISFSMFAVGCGSTPTSTLKSTKAEVASEKKIIIADHATNEPVPSNERDTWHRFEWKTDSVGGVHYSVNRRDTGEGATGFENAIREIEKLNPDKELLVGPYTEGNPIKYPFDWNKLQTVMDKRGLKLAWVNAE
jgi:hypothetical protein